jgi:hypothetical protein
LIGGLTGIQSRQEAIFRFPAYAGRDEHLCLSAFFLQQYQRDTGIFLPAPRLMMVIATISTLGHREKYALSSRGRDQMLLIDMIGLSEADLEKIVADRCSSYGQIASVRVVRLAGPTRSAVALVRMAVARNVDELVAQVGATKSRSTAIIRLQQEGRGKAIRSGLGT